MRPDQNAFFIRYITEAAFGDSRRVWQEYVRLMAGTYQAVEISTDSTQSASRPYIRLALTRLDQRQALTLLNVAGYRKKQVTPLMFTNVSDACFGIGLADYRTPRRETRIKLYNYYHRSLAPVDIGAHLEQVVQEIKADRRMVREDLGLFKKARMSAVDLYPKGERDLKVYYGPFLTKDIWGKFRGLFSREAADRYRELSARGALPELVLFCIRSGSCGRSVRTDFWYMSRDIPAYLKLLDNGTASRLYHDLDPVKRRLALTFVCVDIDQRPRTQFYFEGNVLLTPGKG